MSSFWVLSLYSLTNYKLGIDGFGEYFFKLLIVDVIVLYETLYSLKNEFEVGDDEILLIINKVFEFFFDGVHEKLSIFILFDQPTSEFPSSLSGVPSK
jgi:hypothetical protein